MSQLAEFTNTFNLFITNIAKVIPKQHHSELNSIRMYLSLDAQRTLEYFLDKTKEYQQQILSGNDTFIDEIDFPLFQHYKHVDDYSKACIMEYIKRLYLISLSSQVNKN